ncbi:MAG: arcadin 1 [Nitrososphaerales archaeon]
MTGESYAKKYVRVHRITSINDPETGLPGKQIELVEVRPRTSDVFSGVGEEARLVKGILSQFQNLGIFPPMREMILPKLTMFLTENEYERLGIRFEVNDTYEIILKDGAISLKLFKEGV